MQRVRVGLPVSAARRGTPPRGSWAGRHETERHGSEQCAFRAARRQLDADASDMFDDARADLDQALADGRELAIGEWASPPSTAIQSANGIGLRDVLERIDRRIFFSTQLFWYRS